MNVYVGNLSHQVNEEELRQAFEVFGKVTSSKIITDRYDGTSKGFGFVEMPSSEESEKAISALNDNELRGRKIVVNVARPKENRDDRGNGGNRDYNRGRGSYRF